MACFSPIASFRFIHFSFRISSSFPVSDLTQQNFQQNQKFQQIFQQKQSLERFHRNLSEFPDFNDHCFENFTQKLRKVFNNSYIPAVSFSKNSPFVTCTPLTLKLNPSLEHIHSFSFFRNQNHGFKTGRDTIYCLKTQNSVEHNGRGRDDDGGGGGRGAGRGRDGGRSGGRGGRGGGGEGGGGEKGERRGVEGEGGGEEKESVGSSGPTKTVKIYCSGCGSILYRYRKGGKGALVKCFKERIAEDYTKGDMKCEGCGQEFARFRIIKGKPAHKIIGGKVFMRK